MALLVIMEGEIMQIKYLIFEHMLNSEHNNDTKIIFY